MARKAQTIDIITVIVILVGFTITVVLGLKIYQEFDANYEKGTKAQETLDDAVLIFGAWDTAGVFIIGGLLVTLIISGFFINTHPVFLVINLVVFGASMIVVPQLSNMLTDIMDSDSLSSASTFFPTLAFIRDNYPTIAIVAAMIYFVVLYGKFRGGRNQFAI